MKLCRFLNRQQQMRVGLVIEDAALIDLTVAGVGAMTSLLESEEPAQQLTELARQDLPRVAMDEVRLLAPVEQQEVWAVGVTYLRSKKARMEESNFSASAYDRVYEAARPELFFKALPEKVVGPGE